MEHLASIRDLSLVLARMCNENEECYVELECFGCPFADNNNCPAKDDEKEITGEDWENVIRLLLPEK